MTDQTPTLSTKLHSSCRFSKSSQPEQNGFVQYNLRRRVVNFLRDRGVPELHSLEVEADSGTVIIRGSLSSPQAKWLCLECCRHVAGVITLIDEVDIESPLAAHPSADLDDSTPACQQPPSRPHPIDCIAVNYVTEADVISK